MSYVDDPPTSWNYALPVVRTLVNLFKTFSKLFQFLFIYKVYKITRPTVEHGKKHRGPEERRIFEIQDRWCLDPRNPDLQETVGKSQQSQWL